ncbi:UvrD-helicase domain-containing protein [Sphingomonas suaedae]|nr:UvrD-helicase domain-containing protein [Sphingomonas suaedae]
MTEADAKILECLQNGTSFLLDAAAGSGKTSSLIRALGHIRGSPRAKLIQNAQRVACITYTNVAKEEIIERTENDVIFEVSTIHDFLWREIKGFQRELKAGLITLNDELKATSRRKQDAVELEEALKTVCEISYSDRGANFLEGRIFHDDLIELAHVIFRTYPMMSKLVAARYPFIFVDEYQDTHPRVVEILMNHVAKAATPPVIGFFGDKMQSIYPDVIGEMPAAYEAGLETIKKEENYRCSEAVIAVLNRMRTDIQQVPAGENVRGAAVYVDMSVAAADVDVTASAVQAIREKFGLDLTGETKFLFLTHRLIARKARYEALWTAYNERGGFARERFQSGEDTIAAFFLDQLEPLMGTWRDGKVGKAISLIGTKNTSLSGSQEKARVSAVLNELAALVDTGATIGEVLRKAKEVIPLPDDLETALNPPPPPEEADSSEARFLVFLAKLVEIPYPEVSNYRAVFEENLPYSTKHGVKGDEFENVIVILDDPGANWNQYSFGKLLSGVDNSESRLKRTQNLFYVCCSRARVNLAVVNLAPTEGAAANIKTLFGEAFVATA